MGGVTQWEGSLSGRGHPMGGVTQWEGSLNGRGHQMGVVSYHLQLSSVCVDGHEYIREVGHNLCEGDPAILVHICLVCDVGNLILVQVEAQGV